MEPLGYMSLKASESLTAILNFNGQTNSMETSERKHFITNALSDCFGKCLCRAEAVIANLTALSVCFLFHYPQPIVNFFAKSRPTVSSASNIYTSNSSFYDAGFMACCVSISLFYNSHLR